MKREEEEAEVTKIGERVMPAMERAEKLAQRPMVMGGLLQATPWLGISQRTIFYTVLQDLQKAFGLILTRSFSTRVKPPLGYYQRRGNPREILKSFFMI